MSRVRLLGEDEIDPLLLDFFQVVGGRAFGGSSRAGEGIGDVLHSYQLRAHAPEISMWFLTFASAMQVPHGAATKKMKRLAALATSLANGCRYCVSHSVALGRASGIGEEHIAALDDQHSPLWTEAERAVIDWSRLVTRNEARYDQNAFDRLKTHFTEAEIVELTWMSAFMNMLNRLHDSLHLDLDEEFVIEEEAAIQHRRAEGRSIGERVLALLTKGQVKA